MNAQSPLNETQSEAYDRHQARLERREARRAAVGLGTGGALIGGGMLIFMGLIFLLRNMGIYTFPLYNWWALFLLLPAYGAFAGAYQAYRQAGDTFTRRVGNSLGFGVVMLVFSAAFLFSLNMSLIFPTIIILAGVGILINSFLPKNEE